MNSMKTLYIKIINRLFSEKTNTKICMVILTPIGIYLLGMLAYCILH